MIEDASLGLDMTSVGGLTSVLPVAYGFSKFLSGVLGARTSPTILLSGAGIALCITHCCAPPVSGNKHCGASPLPGTLWCMCG